IPVEPITCSGENRDNRKNKQDCDFSAIFEPENLRFECGVGAEFFGDWHAITAGEFMPRARTARKIATSTRSAIASRWELSSAHPRREGRGQRCVVPPFLKRCLRGDRYQRRARRASSRSAQSPASQSDAFRTNIHAICSTL